MRDETVKLEKGPEVPYKKKMIRARETAGVSWENDLQEKCPF